ncbi:hypothetical protein FGO68_gene16297 [Halteria grandinella]|uniref:Uncharacterized protein n=1 Tax=Halteria grandinella TaxID=5974 RepID=A0A8J8T999_HALGN|nr:hypothetical protein FGO68_gene16297 [Halteria grandinella]
MDIIDNSKSLTDTLEFKNCDFFGNYQSNFPTVLPNLRIFLLQNTHLLENASFNRFPHLEMLKIEKTQIKKSTFNKMINTTVYSYLCKGMTFEMLSSIIYGKDSVSVSDIPALFTHLEADVNFKHSIDQPQISVQQQLKMGLIGAVRICKLTDYETEFSFEMLSTFLESQINNSKDYQPIELRIAKLNDKIDLNQKWPGLYSLQETIRMIAQKVNLEITSIQVTGNDMLKLGIKIKEKQARQLALTYDGKQKWSMFRINGIQEQIFRIADQLEIKKADTNAEMIQEIIHEH